MRLFRLYERFGATPLHRSIEVGECKLTVDRGADGDARCSGCDHHSHGLTGIARGPATRHDDDCVGVEHLAALHLDRTHLCVVYDEAFDSLPHDRAQHGDASRGVAGSPDRVMTVEFPLVDDTDAVAALENAAAAPLGPLSEEPAPGGARLLSARTIEPGAVAGALSAGSAVLTFVAAPSPDYDAELAALLAGVEVKP